MVSQNDTAKVLVNLQTVGAIYITIWHTTWKGYEGRPIMNFCFRKASMKSTNQRKQANSVNGAQQKRVALGSDRNVAVKVVNW